LHEGWDPVISPDGNFVIVSDRYKTEYLVDVVTQKVKTIDWPGNLYGAIAYVNSNLLIYWGMPTKGTEERWTKYYSPFCGPKSLVSIKLAELTTGEFQTILDYQDPRDEFSYGTSTTN
jgi:hypothetical protein